jgi:hypothetical protein
MRVIACRFGIGSVAALAVVVATGVAMARRVQKLVRVDPRRLRRWFGSLVQSVEGGVGCCGRLSIWRFAVYLG